MFSLSYPSPTHNIYRLTSCICPLSYPHLLSIAINKSSVCPILFRTCPSALLGEKRGRFTALKEVSWPQCSLGCSVPIQSPGGSSVGSPVLSLEHRKIKSPVLGYSIAQVHQIFYVGTAASKLRRLCRSLRLLLYRAISSSADEVGVDESRVTNISSSSGCPSCSWGTV